jgi:hypothetical protein
MIRRTRIGASAAAELAEAVGWYEARRPGLGNELRDLVVVGTVLLLRHADLGRTVLRLGSLELRRYLVPKFPFQVVYYVEANDLVIVAFAHTSLRPGYWRYRLVE